MIATVLAWINTFRKALVSAVGIATAILSMSVLPEQYALYVSTGIGIATAILTYVIPNVIEVLDELDDEPIVGGISATQLIEEYEAEHYSQPSETPADAVAEAPPSNHPSEDLGQPETREFDATEVLDALGYK